MTDFNKISHLLHLNGCIPMEFRNMKFSDIKGLDWIKEDLVNWMNDPSKILTLSSQPGRGKTLLACVTARAYAAMLFETGVFPQPYNIGFKFASESDISLTFKAAYAKRQDQDYIHRLFTAPDLFILDDLGEASNTEQSNEITSHIITTRYRANKITIITTNLSSDDITARYGARVTSRILGGKVISLKSLPDFRSTSN